MSPDEVIGWLVTAFAVGLTIGVVAAFARSR